MPDINELYNIVSDVREDVAFIKAKVEAIPDHEDRIRWLEKWKWGLPATLITSVAAGILAILFHGPVVATLALLALFS